MIVQIAPNQYERNLIQDYNEQDLSIKDIYELVKTPVVSETKNNAPYLYPFDMNYEEGKVYATQDNCYSLTMLVFDSDTGFTIDEFKTLFKEYSYALYTTYSHKPDHNKFRAFVDLKQPLTLTSLRTKFFKYWFMKKFPFQDPAIMKFGGVYLPNCRSLDNYEYHINEGRQFDFNDFADEILKQKTKFEKIEKFKAYRQDQIDNKRSNKDISVLYNEKVQDFLSGSYRTQGGNLPFYTALCVAYKANDLTTVSIICEEARRGGWNETEIERKKIDARR